MHRPAVPFLIIATVVALALAAFTWPAASLEPRDLPVGVVGATPTPLADAGAFDVHRYATDGEARAAISDRDVYGAISGKTIYVATAASPAVASALQAGAPGARVVDVVPGSAADPRGATLGALALPLMLVGIVTAILAILTQRTVRRRLALLAGAPVIAGAIGALLTQTWLDALPGEWLALAGAIGLVVLAVSATVTGLASVIGRPGIGVGAVLMMLVANPWSGITSAPELLPAPAGAIGQLMPAGAGGNLLRSVAFFDGAGGAEHLVVLATWAAIGLSLIATAAVRQRGRGRSAVPAVATA